MLSEQLALDLSGRARRDLGLALVAMTQLVDPWTASARRVSFTADEIRERCGDPPRPNLMGALLRWAVGAELIQPDGFRTSERPEARARALRTWRGTDRAWQEEIR